MPKIYQNSMQMFTRVLFFDKIKNWMMPYDHTKYFGFDYFWRVASSSTLCVTLTLLLSYPLELIHTRTCADMSQKGTQRLFTTTFDCFNRTNMDEGKWGLYKGAEIAVVASFARALLQLPVYDFVKRSSIIESSTSEHFKQRIGTALISGLAVTMILYPLDTIKRSM